MTIEDQFRVHGYWRLTCSPKIEIIGRPNLPGEFLRHLVRSLLAWDLRR